MKATKKKERWTTEGQATVSLFRVKHITREYIYRTEWKSILCLKQTHGKTADSLGQSNTLFYFNLYLSVSLFVKRNEKLSKYH